MNDDEKIHIILSLKDILQDLINLRIFFNFEDEETKCFTSLIMRVNSLINEVNNNEI